MEWKELGIALVLSVTVIIVGWLTFKLSFKNIDKKIVDQIKKLGGKTVVEKIYVDENTNIFPEGRNPGFLKKLIERNEESYDKTGPLQANEKPHIEVSYQLDSKSSGGYKVIRTARLFKGREMIAEVLGKKVWLS